MRSLVLLLLVALVPLSCSSDGSVEAAPPSPMPPASGPSSPSPSPSVSIYPVPSIDVRPSRRPSPAVSPSPSVAPVDAGGIACGAQTDATVRHVKVLGRTSCYTVVGSTPVALQAQVNRLEPKAGGKPAVAVTRWRITWSFSLSSATGTCAVARPDVRLATVYVFPTWNPDPGTPASTVDYWRTYMADVRAHEAHHRQIAVDGAVAVRRALLATPTDASCQKVSAAADARAKDVIAQYEAKQRAFDAAAAG